jgi:hypothetical protein
MQKRSPPRTPDWVTIHGEYLAGQRSLREIARQHQVTEGAIRARAKKFGWVRNAPGTKRAMVAARMAGVTQDVAQCVMRNVEQAAEEDVADMQRGLRISRHCLMALEQAAETASEPRDIKVIVDAAGLAIDSIRRIRGLEDGIRPAGASNEEDEARAEEIAGRLERMSEERFRVVARQLLDEV